MKKKAKKGKMKNAMANMAPAFGGKGNPFKKKTAAVGKADAMEAYAKKRGNAR